MSPTHKPSCRIAAALVSPGGLVFSATLNRTAKAFALAIVGGEYIMRWLPRGTHDWRKFVKPSELVAGLEAGGIEMLDLTGVVFNPLTGNMVLRGIRSRRELYGGWPQDSLTGRKA